MNVYLNTNCEMKEYIVHVPDLVQVPDVWINQAKEFQQEMMMYACAIRAVKTKLEVLNDELSVKNQRNPIEMIKSRVKKPASIVEKLRRRGFEVSVESMKKNLDDVAGIRIICSFVDDIYEVAEMLVRQDDVKVIAVKDYIKNPKENGYRSYHIVFGVPVYHTDGMDYYPVEIQLRTMSMDFWASMEHRICYKKEPRQPVAQEMLVEEFLGYARQLEEIEAKMERYCDEPREMTER